LNEEDLEGYLGNNTARLLGLEPTPPPATLEEAKARLAGAVPAKAG
jgi:hypothetical protein